MPGKITSRTVALAAALLAGACLGCGTMVSDVEPEEPVAPAKGTSAPAAIETPPPKPVEPPPPPPPKLSSEEEKHILGILSDMRQKQRRGMMNVPENDGKLLRKLVLESGAKHVVEIGTSNGYSGIWICLALKATGGRLTTYEIDARRAGLARENFKRAGVDGIVTLIEGDAHKEVTKLKDQIDVVFLDADKSGYMDYLTKLLPLVRVGGKILAHNTSSHSRGMKPFLDAIKTSPDLETVFMQKSRAGVSVTTKKR